MRFGPWAATLLGAAVLQPASMSDLMVNVIYPSSDAIFYIETRTPATDAEWRTLERQTHALADAAARLLAMRRGQDDRWTADAALMADASARAIDAAERRDVPALAALNDALYASCVTCHQHYRPNYGRGAAPAASPSAAPAAPVRAAWPPPRTADGHPDLQGVWAFATLTPLERPPELADKAFVTAEEAAAYVRDVLRRGDRDRRDGGAEVDVGRAVNDAWFERGTGLAVLDGRIRTSLVTDPPDGKLPALTADARARAAARAADLRDHPADGPENRSLQERCLSFNAGPPMLPGPYNNYVQILQTASHVIVLNEMIHDARGVPLGGGPHAAPIIRRWLGDPRGRWDGDTLVVDSTNFGDKMNLRAADEHLHLVERFTRVGPDTLLYEFTVDDPTAYTRPWTAQLPMTRTGDRILEYACHEGNYALPDILRGARFQEKQ